METNGNDNAVEKITLIPEFPECLSWTVDDVANWVESIGYPLYKDIFRRNFINGLKLTVIQMSSLPTMGINKLEHILIITKRIRQLLGIN